MTTTTIYESGPLSVVAHADRIVVRVHYESHREEIGIPRAALDNLAEIIAAIREKESRR